MSKPGKQQGQRASSYREEEKLYAGSDMGCNGGTDAGPGSKNSQHQQQQHHKYRQQHSQQLPVFELAAYLAGFIGALSTAGYAFCMQISSASLVDLDPSSLRNGYLGFKMDNTYVDFNYFLSSFAPMLLILTTHLLISRATLRFCSLQLHHLACTAFTLALSCNLLSVKCTAMLLCLHLCCFLASLTGSHLAVWSAILVAFLRFSGASFGSSRDLRLELKLDSRGAHLFYPISGYFYCRLLSMGLTLCSGGSLSALAHLPASLHYTFYLPNFLGGPVVTMDDFLNQKRHQQPHQQSQHLASSILRACRLLLWLSVTLAIVHWLPAGAYLETLPLRLVRHEGPISFAHLAFAMYTRGQLFMLEYVQYYGWPALFARLDGVQLPHWPACICRVTSYREMWRLFDRGLFAIVREHVYIPLGGSRMGLARQLLATAACFGFICLYHGNYDSVQAWILLNLGLVTAELLAVRLYKAGLETALLSWMSPRWLRRLTGVVAAANLIPPSIGIFFFFYGTHAGTLLMREILWKPLTGQSSLTAFAVFLASFYFSVQLAIEYKLRRGRDNKD